MRTLLAALTLLILAQTALAETYYVSPRGDDKNPGTKAKPFKTIQKGADTVAVGDTCLIQSGTYREAIVLRTSGLPSKPIRFVAENHQTVLLDGTEPVIGTWIKHKGSIYKISLDTTIEQLFVGRRMMVEARWPNMDFETQLFDRKLWAATVKGSRYGTIKDPALAGTGFDWTGAHITLNVAHQFFTWTRMVSNHDKGKDTLTYPKDLKGITHYANQTRGWEDDYYFLSGKLEALDRSTEWFYDTEQKMLYFHPPGGNDPSTLDIRCRKRQYALMGKGLKYVELSGIRFFSCSFNFKKCSNILIDRCHMNFPTYSRHVRDPAHKKEYRTGLVGNNNTIRNCTIGFASNTGLSVSGNSNLVEECLIHDVCWYGSLGHPGLKVLGEANISRHNTIYNGGNALLHFRGGNQVVEYNHVYDGGQLCRDVALVYTQLPRCRGTIIHHNWVHGCMTEGFRGHDGLGGMGIRGDDQTRGLTVHHNVVWDCGIHGIIVKGDENRVFNNTVFDVGPNDLTKRNKKTSRHLYIPTRAEPEKPWKNQQHPLLEVQNGNSIYYNNAVGSIEWQNDPLPPSDRITNNMEFRGEPARVWLANPQEKDFRPKRGSKLIDAGKTVPGFKIPYEGEAPDIGAYEYGAALWSAGITWDPKKVLGYVPAGFECSKPR